MTTTTATDFTERGMTSEERKVIFASSLGTVFEWYDFYIYGTLGVFLAKILFTPNVTAECPASSLPCSPSPPASRCVRSAR